LTASGGFSGHHRTIRHVRCRGSAVRSGSCTVAKVEIWLQLVPEEVTVAEAAEQQRVDRSTVVRIRQVAKDGALAALAASKPGVRRQGPRCRAGGGQVEVGLAPGYEATGALSGRAPAWLLDVEQLGQSYFRLRMKLRVCALNCSGFSWLHRCPAPAISTSVELGTAAAIASLSALPVTMSSLP